MQEILRMFELPACEGANGPLNDDEIQNLRAMETIIKEMENKAASSERLVNEMKRIYVLQTNRSNANVLPGSDDDHRMAHLIHSLQEAISCPSLVPSIRKTMESMLDFVNPEDGYFGSEVDVKMQDEDFSSSYFRHRHRHEASIGRRCSSSIPPRVIECDDSNLFQKLGIGRAQMIAGREIFSCGESSL